MRLHLFVALAAADVVFASAAAAVPVTVPTGLDPGDEYRLAFVTSTWLQAFSSNITDYNTFVTGVANSVPELFALGTTWAAIASTSSVDARDNTNTNPGVAVGVPIYLLDGTLLASSNSDLWDGVLGTPFQVDENGSAVPTRRVWTGTRAVGGASMPGFALGSTAALLGLTNTVGWAWAEVGTLPVSYASHAYAVSSTLTVIPEPETAALVAMGLSTLGATRRHAPRHQPARPRAAGTV